MANVYVMALGISNAGPCEIQDSHTRRTTRQPEQVEAVFTSLGGDDRRLFQGEVGLTTSYSLGNNEYIDPCFFMLNIVVSKTFQGSTKKPLLIIPTRLRPLNLLPVILLKSPRRYLIQSQ